MAGIVSTLVQVHVARRWRKGWQHLLLQRLPSDENYPGLWQCVTGTIQAGESAFDAAQREFSEETGLVCQEWWSVPVVASYYHRSTDSLVIVPVFGACVADGSAPSHHPEHSCYRWLSLEQALELLVIPAQREGTQVFAQLLSQQLQHPEIRSLYCLST